MNVDPDTVAKVVTILHEDIETARRKANQIMNWSFAILAGVVFFFAFSCTISVSSEDAYRAFLANTSFLALLVKVIPGALVPAISPLLAFLDHCVESLNNRIYSAHFVSALAPAIGVGVAIGIGIGKF